MNITYVEGTITVTVVAPEAPETPAGIPGFMVPIMIGTVGVGAAVLIRKRKREL
ncbi:MAG: Loki-CTERM sorting domain-containing protein [Candidatus Lokiarchaeia archaeon]